MNVYFTSDLHIGHALVAGHRALAAGITTYLGGISPEVDAQKAAHETSWHDRTLASNWDSVVKPDDQVWILGDISSGTVKAQRAALEWIADRPGEKHLVAGNHDGAHPLHRDSHNWQHKYMREAPSDEYPQGREIFKSVQMAAKRRVSLEPHAKGYISVFLSHFPYKADRGPKVRHPEWRLKNTGTILLHGHTHSSERLSYDVDVWKDTPQIHVGLDAWGMELVPWEKIRELILHVAGVPMKEELDESKVDSHNVGHNCGDGGNNSAP
jgi:calcineurin-like phosphoesterase family protein